MILTDQQHYAVSEAVESLSGHESGHAVPLFRIGGYAGTGKTTIAKEIYDQVPNGCVCAFTGKAASVLRSKGLPSQTIHSAIYKWDSRRERFIRRLDVPWDWFLVDEGSMVSQRLWDHLRGYGKPMVVIGDPGQLEPIGDDPRLMHDPDLVLDEIHRQAEQSAIIRLATAVRAGGEIAHGEDGEVTVGEAKLFWDSLDWADQLICGRNKTRVAANTVVRQLKGFTEPIEIGERLICLQNDNDLGLWNGLLLTVTQIHSGSLMAELDAVADDGTEHHSLLVPTEYLGQERAPDWKKTKHLKGWAAVCDYGYCLTCHKFQGSEADKVAVIDEQCDFWDPARWRYTAITRAAKELRYAA